MEFGSVAQWIGILVTLLLFTLSLSFGMVRWQINTVYSTIEQAKAERNRLVESTRNDALTQAARAEAAAARATADVARLELKMAEKLAELREQSRNDVDAALDKHFNHFYLRLDTLERRLGLTRTLRDD